LSESLEHAALSKIDESKLSDDFAIQFRDANLKINGKSLVEDLRFDILRGETLVLLGRSGSGKTTTLKLINRLLEPTGGEVRVEADRPRIGTRSSFGGTLAMSFKTPGYFLTSPSSATLRWSHG
jgi:ABC-type multidrug transport system fused ATPase/permease subunit